MHLQYGQMLMRQERAFEYDYFQLPPVSPSMTTHRWTLCRVPCTVCRAL